MDEQSDRTYFLDIEIIRSGNVLYATLYSEKDAFNVKINKFINKYDNINTNVHTNVRSSHIPRFGKICSKVENFIKLSKRSWDCHKGPIFTN